jgi:hypothetical protein
MAFDSPFSALAAFRHPSRVVLAETASVPATGGVLALGQLRFDPSDYPANAQISFVVVTSVSVGSITGSVLLYNVDDAEVVTGTSLATSSLTPVSQSSGALTVGAAAGNLKDTPKLYEVRLAVSGTLVSEVVSLGSAALLIQ